MKQRIGIFGGSFNPFHKGHLNNVLNVAGKIQLDKILIIPAYQTPHKDFIKTPSPDQRLRMVQLGCLEHRGLLEVDGREVQRKGISYTITTLKQLSRADVDLFLIMGLDLFYHFDRWKDYEAILKIAHLVVTSRPNYFFPESLEQFPKGLRCYVETFQLQNIQMTSGKRIQFVQIEEDILISSTHLRQKLKNNKATYHYLDPKVEAYIKTHHIYQKAMEDKSTEAFTQFCGKILDQQKAIDIKAYHLKPLSSITDYSLIASGKSRRHTQSLSDVLIQNIKDEFCVLPLSVEGSEDGHWILIDYGSLIVHIFYNDHRKKYDLESLWSPSKPFEL